MTEENHPESSLPDQINQKAVFDDLTKPYRYELLIHCYRILGSIEDAEDGLQETMLRAWRHLNRLRDPSALRPWLYRIATNVSLDLLESHKVRSLPHLTYEPADPLDALPAPNAESTWLDPLPEFYLADYTSDPEQQQEALEHVTFAFLVVLQHLPGRQRAILLLHDVLDWKAREVADALNMTVAAVNSALQRARATLKKQPHVAFGEGTPDSDNLEIAALLTKYVQAWETADLPRLMALIHADAKLTMPPLPVWYLGREHIQIFLNRHVFEGRQAGDFQLIHTRSNKSPAFAVYQRDETGEYQLAALHILMIRDEKIVQIDDFLALNQTLFSRLHRPTFLDDR